MLALQMSIDASLGNRASEGIGEMMTEKQPSEKMTDQPVPRIEFRDVSLAYDDQVVLDHVSFMIWPAEMKLLLGESGGGKSTVIKLVLGLEKPDSGEIFIDGEGITRLSEEELDQIRKKMGVVFQEGALFDSLSLFENVAYRLQEHGEDEKVIERKVEQILNFVGLKGLEDKLPSELSGGMKRRVAIARAVVDSPEIVLFDEPTTGLDPPTAGIICELGLKLRDVLGVSSIWVTHRIEDVRFLSSKYIVAARGDVTRIQDEGNKLCLVNTKIVMLHHGRVIFEGTDEQFWHSDEPFIREFLEFDTTV
jgi:phospholipid/cholesterol/gamma-HCH transport system ATP-binding protein